MKGRASDFSRLITSAASQSQPYIRGDELDNDGGQLGGGASSIALALTWDNDLRRESINPTSFVLSTAATATYPQAKLNSLDQGRVLEQDSDGIY